MSSFVVLMCHVISTQLNSWCSRRLVQKAICSALRNQRQSTEQKIMKVSLLINQSGEIDRCTSVDEEAFCREFQLVRGKKTT